MKVLIIDDDEKCLKSIGKSLEINGIPNNRFSDPAEAVKSFRANEYTAVVTDIKMAGMSGFDVLKSVKYIDPKTYVIVLSAHDDIEYIQTAKELGAHEFFHKSVAFETFLNALLCIERTNDTI